MTIGNAIKLIRTARRIRQRELALKLKVSPNYLSMLEADKREPSIATLRNIARELSVPAGLFLLWGEPVSAKLHPSKIDKLRDLLVRIQAIYLEEEQESNSRKTERITANEAL